MSITTNNVGITDIQQPLRIILYAIYIILQQSAHRLVDKKDNGKR
ncbi:hypothetical protein [Sphingobacterium sp.]